MIQSIMILTFFVSAAAVAADRTKKINDNEHTLQATRRLNGFCLLPSKRAAVIAYLHPSRARIALPEGRAYCSLASPSTNATSLSILRHPRRIPRQLEAH